MKDISLAITGHIDHGKSTLIGRLLYDTKSIKQHEIDALTSGDEIDFAHFLDIYTEERNNNMTIDTTRRFFKTENCKYMIIDSPGHKEFIKNMLSGVSEADCALVIISEEGIKEQTKRHLTLLNLLDIQLSVVAVNKMDLANYDEDRFNKIVNELKTFLKSISYDSENTEFVPIVAKNGENVVNKSENMNWYDGRTIVEELDAWTPNTISNTKNDFRMSVQSFVEDGNLLFGRVESGSLDISDELIFLPSKTITPIEFINVGGVKVETAKKGDSVVLKLNSGPISRGEIAGCSGSDIKASKRIIAKIFLPHEAKLVKGEEITLTSGPILRSCVIKDIVQKFDSETLNVVTKHLDRLDEYEIGIVELEFAKPVVLEKYSEISELGRFVLTKGNDSFPGIVVNLCEENNTMLACSISPDTPIDEILKNKRVGMLRFNGAFPLPNFDEMRERGLPMFVDLPNGRKKTMTTTLNDEEIIQECIKNKVDYLALSYVDAPEEIHQLRKKLEGTNIKIIAKLETEKVLSCLDEVIKISDMVLVDRGDLGTAIGYEKVPVNTDKIINLCKKYGKKVMVATGVALSTMDSESLSYSDAFQTHNFVERGVDYLVLAEETARNKNAVLAVELITKVINEISEE